MSQTRSTDDARDDHVTGVVVVAAGMGTRLGAGRPKALVEVGGTPLVVHAVRRAQAARGVTQVVVVAPAGHLPEFRSVVGDSVDLVAGGAERTESVAAGLAALAPQVGVVLVHDAARALASSELFERVASEVRAGYDAVVPGVAVVDTVKQVDADGQVVSTPERAALRAVQTPQGFRRELLVRAHERADQATDDAALVERLGGRVLVIDGEAQALKVTTPADLVAIERLHAGAITGPVLIVLGGLPGVGKTAIARALTVIHPATHLRVDTIEWALHRAGVRGAPEAVHPFAGYATAYAVAADQLRLGGSVIADTVNPVPETRRAWRAVGEQSGVPVLEVEVACSDPTEHRRRVESRSADIEGHVLPQWDAVRSREYTAWEPSLRVDTAEMTPAQAASVVLDAARGSMRV